MTPLPQAGDLTGLLERLEAKRKLPPRKNRLPTFVRRNPDGPEAAQAMRHLSADLEACRKALEEIARLPELSNGPVDDFDRGARAARLDAADIALRALQPKEPA